jgi:hypothetical protein
MEPVVEPALLTSRDPVRGVAASTPSAADTTQGRQSNIEADCRFDLPKKTKSNQSIKGTDESVELASDYLTD